MRISADSQESLDERKKALLQIPSIELRKTFLQPMQNIEVLQAEVAKVRETDEAMQQKKNRWKALD